MTGGFGQADCSMSHLSLSRQVELYVKDQYIGRSDMWRLGVSWEGRCLQVGQEVSLLFAYPRDVASTRANLSCLDFLSYTSPAVSKPRSGPSTSTGNESLLDTLPRGQRPSSGPRPPRCTSQSRSAGRCTSSTRTETGTTRRHS